VGWFGREGHSLRAEREPPGNAFSDQIFRCTAAVRHTHTQASPGTSGRSVNDKAHSHLVSNKTTHRFGSTEAIRIHGARKSLNTPSCYINTSAKDVISAVKGCGYKHEVVVVMNMK